MEKNTQTLTLHTKCFRNGIYKMTDQRGDKTWGDVEATIDHRNHEGELRGSSNYQSYTKANEEMCRLAGYAEIGEMIRYAKS